MMGGHGWLSSQVPGPLSFGQAIYDGFLAPLVGSNVHNGVLWTMNVEFLGSIGLFGFAALFYKSRLYWLCVLVASAVSIYLMKEYGIHFSLFLAGSLLFKYRYMQSKSAWILLIPLGFFLGVLKPWHSTMLALQSWFGYDDAVAFQIRITLNSLGGLAIVYSVVTTKIFHSLLSTRFFKYLGDISFSLYLIHLPIFFSIGCVLFVSLAHLGNHFAAIFAFFSTVIVSIFVSHLMYKTADKFSIILSNVVAEKFLRTFRQETQIASENLDLPVKA